MINGGCKGRGKGSWRHLQRHRRIDAAVSLGSVFGELVTVEREFRETLALCYLLERLGSSDYAPGQGQPALLDELQDGWSSHDRSRAPMERSLAVSCSVGYLRGLDARRWIDVSTHIPR
jgi:hypothetical protein